MALIDTQSQLEPSPNPPQWAGSNSAITSKTVSLDLHTAEDATCCDDNTCEGCSGRSSFAQAATCAMVGASTRTNQPKTLKSRLIIQSFYWSITFIAAIISLPALVPVMSEPLRLWTQSTLLNSSLGTTIAWILSALFAIGFVHKLGRDRLTGGCAMIRRLGPAAILGVAWATLPSFAGVLLVLNMEPIRIALVGDAGSTIQLITGLGIYTVAFIILAGLGCLPTVSQAILAGYTFGIGLGLPAALIGFGGASLIGYELVQRFARGRVETELSRSSKITTVRDALLTASTPRAILIITLLRASPSAPFALTNLMLGCLGVSRKAFFLGTVLGMFPRTLAAVMIGLSFTGWNGGFDQPRWVIVAGIIATIMLLIVISKVAASALIKVARKDQPVAQPAAA